MAGIRPIAMAPAGELPNMNASKPIAPALPPACATPVPKTSRRIAYSRAGDNSRPIMSIRNTMPSSASESIRSTS